MPEIPHTTADQYVRREPCVRMRWTRGGCSAGTTDADGWVQARVPIEPAARAPADFLRLGADIEILEPAELRDQAARTIRAMAAIYD